MLLRKRALCLGSGTFVDFNKCKTAWLNPGYVPPLESHGSNAQLRR